MEAILNEHVETFQAVVRRLYQQGEKNEALVFHKERKAFVQVHMSQGVVGRLLNESTRTGS